MRRSRWRRGESSRSSTTDCLVEGVHFDLAFSTLADVGYRALAVNVSDVAAMGATPRLALLSLILPATLTVAGVEALPDGFAEMAQQAGVTWLEEISRPRQDR